MWYLGLFLLGLVARLAIVASRPDALEAWEYDTLARNIVAGDGYVIDHFGHATYAFGDGNLYSFLAATVYLVTGHQPLVLAVVQAIIGALAAPIIFAIGWRALGWLVAGCGAALAALHPGLLAYSLNLHPLGLDVVLMALMVLWITRVGSDVRSGLGAGFAMGMALMSRPTFFLAGLAALGLRWRGSSPRPHARALGAAVVVALLIAAPWITRNWIVLGRPLLVSTSLEDVWKGNNPDASGSSYLPNGQDIFTAAPPELQARLEKADDELQVNDIFAQEITAFVTQHPLDFATLFVRKFVYFWWLSPQTGSFYPASWLAAYSWYAVVVFGFAIVGSVVIVRRGTPEERALLGMLAAVSLTLAVIHALAYVEGRHRWGIEPLLLLLTARGIFTTAAALRSARPRLA